MKKIENKEEKNFGPEEEARKIVSKLLNENELCVLATATLEGKPEAATIEFVADKEGNIYFETFPSYRKYVNLKKNPQASIVITQESYTLQMDGTVTELKLLSEIKAKARLIKKHGLGSGFYFDKTITFFKFTPSWTRVLVEARFPPKYVVVKGEGPKGVHTLH
ncbi:pyridoxamine 5'-phosphate oxidase family protein [Candidatus Woesearchaeota archaeon]|nr:pyridoxamine 5'-phosphate oxidase family protein [Candidatus Woesearchaeota archaeon]